MEQIFNIINKLNAAQRAVIIGGFSILFVFLMGLLVYSNMKSQDEKFNYLIASNLTKSQVMLASNELEAAGVPFSILGSGDSLSLKTNKKNINVAKIKLLVSQSVTSGHSGWEIFDKSSLGTTNFENKVKYRRALEGELSRSLESLNGILGAKVKIGQPKESIFTQRKMEPTASAVLRLRDGSSLNKRQIEGIKNFIASAVPNLKPKNIKLINQNGTLLEYSSEDIDNTKYIAQNKYKKKLERDYEQNIIEILEPFIGLDRVVAKVSVILDFTKRDIQQEIYDPEGTIRSQQTTEITSNNEEKEDSVGGTAGVQSNIQNPDEASGGVKAKSSKEEAKNIINYEISKKIISQKNSAFALINRITTAVTFDSTVLDKATNKEDFLKNINSIVEETVGFKEKRGDKVSVKSFKFIGFGAIGDANATIGEDADEGIGAIAIKSIMQDFGEYIQYLIASILLFVFYKKFISSNEIVLSGGVSSSAKTGSASGSDFSEGAEPFNNFDDSSFNRSVAKNRLKAKVKSQILNNIEGLDEESAAKYEILIEELDKEVQNKPEDIAAMIEMLLFEGDEKLKS
ncbi:MAG: flagellar M-ring protein FliF [Arcobacteraceae bacterium]|nr:flagellar M-ring protein FliF [Arcobacteraceae bacterium]